MEIWDAMGELGYPFGPLYRLLIVVPNHVATATTSKIMRVYNKSELFEPRKRVLRQWAELIEGLATSPQ
jgi:hypothetical protein